MTFYFLASVQCFNYHPHYDHYCKHINPTVAVVAQTQIKPAITPGAKEVTDTVELPRVIDSNKLYSDKISNKPLNKEETNSKNQEVIQEVPKTATVSPVNESAPSPPNPSPQPIPPIDPKNIAAQWGVLPVGIEVDGRMVVKSTLVRGTEDGSQAIQFDDWLVPYDSMIKALNIRVTNLPNGQVQLRSRTVIFNLDLSRLKLDPEIGAVLSIRDVKDWFGITPEFNINNYGIQIKYPATNQSDPSKVPVEPPIDFTNIPHLSAPRFTVTTINKQETTENSPSRGSQNQTFSSSGSLLGGSWLLTLNQTRTQDKNKNENILRLGSASYTLNKSSTDLFIGSQQPFWPSTSPKPFWGVTAVKRWGFTMPLGNGGNANTRVRPTSFGQTVRGQAAPGTLVQLLSRYNQQLFAEVLVDESGKYSFNDITLSEVRLLLYPQGKLTSKPEERIVNLPIIPGQSPSQTSSLMVSAGTRRNNFTNNKQFLGTFSDLSLAANYRYGVSQELTLGAIASYDNGFSASTELLFQPENTPLQITASALTPTLNTDWDLNANIQYNPTPKIKANLATDLQRSSLNISGTILPRLSLFSNFNYDYTASSPFRYNIGTRTNILVRKISASLALQWNSVTKLKWDLTGKIGNLELQHSRSNFLTKTNLTYNLLGNSRLKTGNSYNSLGLSYQTLASPGSSNSKGDSLLTLNWRFQPNKSKLQVELGYIIGSNGSGFMTNFSHEIFSGLFLQANYSNVGLGSNSGRFELSLSTNFDFKRGVYLKDSSPATGDIFSGILLKPFLDKNNNGTREPTEPLIVKKFDSLLILNNKPISQYPSEVTDNEIVVPLDPGLYRLDLDPSSYPLDWYPTKNTAVGIEVTGGGFTEVLIPFARSYTISGTATDSQGKVMSGAKVEAVSSTSSHRVFSITSADGIYYLEGLIDPNYNLFINNIPAAPKTIDLSQSSEPYQQLNLRLKP